MTPQQFVSTITDNVNNVADAISTGSAWEVWLQVQLLLWLRGAGIFGGRELQYPTNARLHIDLVLQDNADTYGIEMKVQNARNSRLDLVMGVLADVEKLKQYGIPGLKPQRWAVGIAYTPDGRVDLNSLAKGLSPNSFYYSEANPLTILVVQVPTP